MSRIESHENPRFIWVTRGRTWGFRFLRDGGYEDPLPVYETAFSGVDGEPKVWRRDAGSVALRFPDPDGRMDAAGRVIPHEFVVFEPEADQINSFEDGFRLVWGRVADEFENIWNETVPPPTSG